MTWLLFTMLLCALGTAQASAQNTVSQELLELSEDERNAAFTRLLRASDQNCDQVIRTLEPGRGAAAESGGLHRSGGACDRRCERIPLAFCQSGGRHGLFRDVKSNRQMSYAKCHKRRLG